MHFHALCFNKFLLQIWHHRLYIHLVSSLDLADEKLSSAFVYVIPGGHGGAAHFDASPLLQHTICHLHQIAVQCHIRSVIHWTQEVRQTSSDLHDLYGLFSTYHTLTWWHASNRWAPPPTSPQPDSYRAGSHSLLLAALISLKIQMSSKPHP